MINKGARIPVVDDFVSNPGEEYHILFKSTVLPSGVIKLEEDGKEDIRQMINAQAERTDMKYILRQMELGNFEAFSRTPNYGDFSDFPTSYQEVLQVAIDSEKMFYQLPIDIRSSFDNDFNKWLVTQGQPEWFEKMGYKDKDVIKEEKVQEVSE